MTTPKRELQHSDKRAGPDLRIDEKRIENSTVTITEDGTCSSGMPEVSGVARVWLMMSLILPRSVHSRVFLPAFNDSIDDYNCQLRHHARNFVERCWIRVAFSCQFSILVGLTTWLMIREIAAGVRSGLLPASKKKEVPPVSDTQQESSEDSP